MALTLAALNEKVAKLATDVQVLISQDTPGIAQADIDAISGAVQTIDDAVTAATTPPAPAPPAPAPAPAPAAVIIQPSATPDASAAPAPLPEMIMPGLPHTAAGLSGGQ